MSFIRNVLKKKIFISYSRANKAPAEEIALALRAEGYTVFFDQTDLPPGQSFNDKIRSAIESSDVFIFLISPEALARGAYTLSELEIARSRWPNPGGSVLPVAVGRTSMSSIPAYLRATTIMEAKGNLAIETALAVRKLVGTPLTMPDIPNLWPKKIGLIGLMALFASFAGLITHYMNDEVQTHGVGLAPVIGWAVWYTSGRHAGRAIFAAAAVLFAGYLGWAFWKAGEDLGNDERLFFYTIAFGLAAQMGLAFASPRLRKPAMFFATPLASVIALFFAYWVSLALGSSGLIGWMGFHALFAAWVGFLLSGNLR